ncbi:hypothetical protein [Corynebacterium sp.]|uniref:hypothetical protein n=1 Tax=Corynebacterium sp. TaxID=1720 RepID=UPI0026DB61C3|nr:hypothetical protein [Corynebacterium sp.]MDO5031297.1 hypothetical protein [Corynebacterium sp.]
MRHLFPALAAAALSTLLLSGCSSSEEPSDEPTASLSEVASANTPASADASQEQAAKPQPTAPGDAPQQPAQALRPHAVINNPE